MHTNHDFGLPTERIRSALQENIWDCPQDVNNVRKCQRVG
jgi:hypothetical protein